MRTSFLAIAALAGAAFMPASAQIGSAPGAGGVRAQKPQSAQALAHKQAAQSSGLFQSAAAASTSGGWLGTGGDDCAAPTAVSGQGDFPFDNGAATTGGEGQSNSLCFAFGTSGVNNDVWFDWTPDCDGDAVVTMCGGTGVDTKIAGYDGGGCPTGAALACNDDTCGLQSEIGFAVANGSVYGLQIGTFPGSSGGSGTFNVTINNATNCGSGGTGADDCAAADDIGNVLGPVPFDNGAATTGSEGQSNSLCFAFGTSAVGNDVWFNWTAPDTGDATVTMCGGTSVDTKIAAYDGGGCPAGSAIACNDDTCGLQSEITFAVNAGSVYGLQIGSFPGSSGGSGTMDISLFVPPPITGSDDCATADAISGQGAHGFDNSAATTGPEGQSNSLCLAFGSSAVDNDVWFDWTSDADGDATVTMCGGTGVDTKIAAYDGGGCPAGSAIACNDDTCGLQSEISFAVNSGSVYGLQIGSFPGASGGSGSFTITVEDAPVIPCVAADDGGSENALGLSAGGTIAMLHHTDCDVVDTVHAAYGSAAFPGTASDGRAADIYVWADSDGDIDPGTGLALLASVSAVTTNANTDILNCYTIAGGAVTAGDGWIGAAIENPAGEFPCPLDMDNPWDGAWIGGDTTGNLDPNNLGAGDVGLIPMNFIVPSAFLLRANEGACPIVCELSDSGPGDAFCCGLGCPCSNDDNTAGCANSGGAGGTLGSGGSTGVLADDLEMHASGLMLGQPVQLFSARDALNGGAGFPFIDGLRCTGVELIRHDIKLADATGAASWVGSLGSEAGMVPGDERHFQVFYRDAVSACGTGANTTNATTVVFTP
jgi:hypothetical protein